MITAAVSALFLLYGQSPDTTVVGKFFDAVKAKNYTLARSMVKTDGTPFKRTPGLDMIEEVFSRPDQAPFSIGKVTVVSGAGQRAFKVETIGRGSKLDEIVPFEIVGGKTLLTVPADVKKISGIVGAMVAMMDNDRSGIYSKLMVKAKEAAEDTQALSSVKQLGTGIMIYLSDHDDKLPTTGWKKEIGPYVKNPKLFNVTKAGKSYPVSFNAKLSKVNVVRITNPNKTIMLYVGTGNKPLFIFGGKAIFCFADGSARKLSPSDLTAYSWNP